MRKIDKVRASRDGHEYHEAWTARKAMQLVLGEGQLVGIAVEGLEPGDQSKASSEIVEVADLTLYFGKEISFECAERVEIIQVKYSPSRSSVEFRASDAKKTIAKFAASYKKLTADYGECRVGSKLVFQLITNRPIYPPLVEAIDKLAVGSSLSGPERDQARQFKAAAGLNERDICTFAAKCRIAGLAGGLYDSKRDLSMLLVDWSAASDILAAARLGTLREMVRTKAGFAGTNRNVIRDIDVLAALGIPDQEALLPCPSCLVDVGEVVQREQLPDAVALIPTLSVPLLVHAAGGVGKTVFMRSLAGALKDRYETVFFDCFGGGAYRSPEDARHHPRRGLIHIANSLACRGLCDPILPGGEQVEELLRTFRRRLEQAVATMSRVSPKKRLLLLLDAIDNAAEHARDLHEPSFATLMLESLQHAPVPGLAIVVSSRSYRVPIRDIPHRDFELRPFSQAETEAYLGARLPSVTKIEIGVAQARSNGNPRILEYLVKSGRGLLDPSEIDNKIGLSDLLRGRIRHALSEAGTRGYKPEDTAAFLAGLAVLPPPVPVDEYAEAHGMPLAAIESFAADLSPLLERTKHGLMFRDEPTETLIKDEYASRTGPLRKLASTLLARQDRSVYAARALPGLLRRLGDGQQLFALAFDERFPQAIASTVGKRRIRYERLKAAVQFAAAREDYDQLVHLLLELSAMAGVDQRGAAYILASPDLVVAAGDVDASRRLFEVRAAWQGTRHARLAIAHTLSGDLGEATRHALRTSDWLKHYLEQDEEYQREVGQLESLDVAAAPFVFVVRKAFGDAVRFMRRWKGWYAYEVGRHLFGLLEQQQVRSGSTSRIKGFLGALTEEVGCLAAALSFLELNRKRQKELIRCLASAHSGAGVETGNGGYRMRDYTLEEGLRKSAAIAASLSLRDEAAAIAELVPHTRPDAWYFRDIDAERHVFPFIFHVALRAGLKGEDVTERDILPAELEPVLVHIKAGVAGPELTVKIKKALEDEARANSKDGDSGRKTLSPERRQEVQAFIDQKLAPILELTRAFSGVLGARVGKADQALHRLIRAWVHARDRGGYYGRWKQDPFFQLLGCQILAFAVWARSDLRPRTVATFLARLHEQEIVSPYNLIRIVETLARRGSLQNLAGEEAIRARRKIETLNEVRERASLYAKLGRAILPASRDEAAKYFRAGLDQLDTVGSGDFEFTNELLLFAVSLRGSELAESDFHTLANICELNLTDEPEKFPWFAFGKAMSRASGCRGLARLSRWDDRETVALRYTLRPYLVALLEDKKIGAEDALALNRLAVPAEFYDCSTETLGNAIVARRGGDARSLVLEFAQQLEENGAGRLMNSTLRATSDVVKRELRDGGAVSRRLAEMHAHFVKVRLEQDGYTSEHVGTRRRSGSSAGIRNGVELRRIWRRTNPLAEASLAQAVSDVEKIDHFFSSWGDLFAGLRRKVGFGERGQYLKALSNTENLNLHAKLEELRKCKDSWRASSGALSDALKPLAEPLMRRHLDDLLSQGQLSGYKLKEMSELLETPSSVLAVGLISLCAEQDETVPAAVWLGLARFVSEEAAEAEGQAALRRLLRSEAAKLSATVVDGEWKSGAYPDNDAAEVVAGLVWRMLGDPNAADRWRAAHSVRRLAKFGRWSIVDALVAGFDREDAGPFQAPELAFFHMHARVWLLIALERVALDHPKEIARYKDVLLGVVRDKYGPDVVMRHFAARTLIACAEAGEVEMSKESEDFVRHVDRSPLPRLKKRLKDGSDFYRERPATMPKTKKALGLDYDFDKYDVQWLSDVFGRPRWEIVDSLSEIVAAIDPKVTKMWETGGRVVSNRHLFAGQMTSSCHTYGQQLAWNGIHLVAGDFLRRYPVTEDSVNSEPWDEWLGRYLLTRSDGLWLADGMDGIPLDVPGILLEKTGAERAITGDRKKLLSLAGLHSRVPSWIAVSGHWRSADQVSVTISSVLVEPRKAVRLASQLVDEEPVHVWLPEYREHDEGWSHFRERNIDCTPWVNTPSAEAELDEDDPLGSVDAIRRPRIGEGFACSLGLRPADPSCRTWTDARGRIVARSDAWGRRGEGGDEERVSGVRLRCSRALLKDVLMKHNSDLILLLRLQRYEERRLPGEESKFTHTVAVIRLTRSLGIKYYRGRINYSHRLKY